MSEQRREGATPTSGLIRLVSLSFPCAHRVNETTSTPVQLAATVAGIRSSPISAKISGATSSSDPGILLEEILPPVRAEFETWHVKLRRETR